jgi:cytochrome c oxidase subunit IV
MSTATAPAPAPASAHSQHPIGIYFKIWGLLFVLSAFSYLVDFFHVHGHLRWTLILMLMMAKASLIVAYFMHLKWERLALIYTIVIPPTALLVLVALMMVEGDYTFFTRMTHFG